MQRFEGRVAVVTGAASGIGRATSLALAERGCALAVADIDEDGLAETAEMVEKMGRKVSSHRVDVADKERMRAFADEVATQHGKINVVVNNAGVAVQSTLEDHDLDDFEWLMGINFWGVVYGSKFFLPHLLNEGEGHIVNISSLFGLIGVPTQSAYCSSKFAVRGFSESLYAELQGTGVGVTSVHPGGIKTNIVASARTMDESEREEMIEQFDRFGSPPEKVANGIVRAIERRQLRLLVTPESHVGDWMKRVMPTWASRLMAVGYRRRSART